jgi:hypothetical protein
MPLQVSGNYLHLAESADGQKPKRSLSQFEISAENQGMHHIHIRVLSLMRKLSAFPGKVVIQRLSRTKFEDTAQDGETILDISAPR